MSNLNVTQLLNEVHLHTVIVHRVCRQGIEAGPTLWGSSFAKLLSIEDCVVSS